MIEPRLLSITDLRAGDVLLHMGCGELSKLIAWMGDGAYSHAALVIDQAQLIEAAASGVRHAGLLERTRMLASFHYIDVFRPLHPAPDDAQDRALLLSAINVYLGRPYPMTSLLMLGLVCAVRNKIPADPAMREAIRMALDEVVENDNSKVVCSELVYRGFDEAATTPAHTLRLKVIMRPVQNTPVPSIDFKLLLTECLDDLRRSRPNNAVRNLSATEDAMPVGMDELLARARARLGLDGVLMAGAGDYAANPKTVLPADLEFSPSLRRIGRLAMSATSGTG